MQRHRRLAWIVLLAGLAAWRLLDPPGFCIDAGFRTVTECGGPISWPLVIFIALALAILEAAWTIADRARSRPCPRCGFRVRNGKLACGHCSYDFRAA